MELKQFPLIDNIFYGTRQHWLPEIARQNSGCGAAAAANLAFYYTNKFAPTKDEAVALMEDIYKNYVKQTIGIDGTGVWFIDEFKNDMLHWFKDNGFKATAHVASDVTISNASKAVKMIEDAISSGNPIVLQNWVSKYVEPMHYVTITGCQQNGDDFDLTVSTWGQKINYREFMKIWNDNLPLASAFLCYFTVTK